MIAMVDATVVMVVVTVDSDNGERILECWCVHSSDGGEIKNE